MLDDSTDWFQALDEAYPGDWALCLIPLQPRSKVCRQAGWNDRVAARLANGADRTEHLRRCACLDDPDSVGFINCLGGQAIYPIRTYYLRLIDLERFSGREYVFAAEGS